MKLHFHHDFRDTPGTTLIVPVLQDKATGTPVGITPVADHCQLAAATIAQRFKANAHEVFPLIRGEEMVILLGLGTHPDFATTLKAFAGLVVKYGKWLGDAPAVSWLHADAPADLVLHTEAAANGLCQGNYHVGVHKTDPGQTNPTESAFVSLAFYLPEAYTAAAQTAANQGWHIGQTQLRIMGLVDAPANFKKPQRLAEYAVEAGKQYGFRTEIWDKVRLHAEGMHALLAVNQGSVDPAVFIIMEYKGKPGANGLPKIGLVGKGVTFDTGGLSIKPSTNLHYMKSDMGGAAAVLGTLEAAARLQLPVHLVGVIPATDNSVDALSVQPSDVISSYSGKSIEVIDTDAEGRLVLADGLSYIIRQHQPDVVIDLATLTGAAVRTFGYTAAALFSNDDQLANHLTMAGQKSGERLWRLPLWDDYADDMKSDVADIKNFSGKPVAGAISAAKFLEFFIDEHPSWAHLDIAGVAFGDTPYAKGKTATGYGVRLLVEFIQSLGGRANT